jgi:hypothetical protein
VVPLLHEPLPVAPQLEPIRALGDAQAPGLVGEVDHAHRQDQAVACRDAQLHGGGGVEPQHVAQDPGAFGWGQFQAVLAEGRGVAVLHVVVLVREGAGDGSVGHEIRQPVRVQGPQLAGHGHVGGFHAVDLAMALEVHHGLVGQAPVHQVEGEARPGLQLPLPPFQGRDAEDHPIRCLGQHPDISVEGAEDQLDNALILDQPLEDHADGLGLILVEAAFSHPALSGAEP